MVDCLCPARTSVAVLGLGGIGGTHAEVAKPSWIEIYGYEPKLAYIASTNEAQVPLAIESLKTEKAAMEPEARSSLGRHRMAGQRCSRLSLQDQILLAERISKSLDHDKTS